MSLTDYRFAQMHACWTHTHMLPGQNSNTCKCCVLENVYKTHAFPNKILKRALADHLHLRKEVVSDWFKWKRLKDGILPQCTQMNTPTLWSPTYDLENPRTTVATLSNTNGQYSSYVNAHYEWAMGGANLPNEQRPIPNVWDTPTSMEITTNQRNSNSNYTPTDRINPTEHYLTTPTMWSHAHEVDNSRKAITTLSNASEQCFSYVNAHYEWAMGGANSANEQQPTSNVCSIPASMETTTNQRSSNSNDTPTDRFYPTEQYLSTPTLWSHAREVDNSRKVITNLSNASEQCFSYVNAHYEWAMGGANLQKEQQPTSNVCDIPASMETTTNQTSNSNYTPTDKINPTEQYLTTSTMWSHAHEEENSRKSMTTLSNASEQCFSSVYAHYEWAMGEAKSQKEQQPTSNVYDVPASMETTTNQRSSNSNDTPTDRLNPTEQYLTTPTLGGHAREVDNSRAKITLANASEKCSSYVNAHYERAKGGANSQKEQQPIPNTCDTPAGIETTTNQKSGAGNDTPSRSVNSALEGIAALVRKIGTRLLGPYYELAMGGANSLKEQRPIPNVYDTPTSIETTTNQKSGNTNDTPTDSCNPTEQYLTTPTMWSHAREVENSRKAITTLSNASEQCSSYVNAHYERAMGEANSQKEQRPIPNVWDTPTSTETTTNQSSSNTNDTPTDSCNPTEQYLTTPTSLSHACEVNNSRKAITTLSNASEQCSSYVNAHCEWAKGGANSQNEQQPNTCDTPAGIETTTNQKSGAGNDTPIRSVNSALEGMGALVREIGTRILGPHYELAKGGANSSKPLSLFERYVDTLSLSNEEYPIDDSTNGCARTELTGNDTPSGSEHSSQQCREIDTPTIQPISHPTTPRRINHTCLKGGGLMTFDNCPLCILQGEFARDHYPSIHDINDIAQRLQLRTNKIKTWFKHKRARERKRRVRA